MNIGSDWSEIISAGKGTTSPAAVLTTGSVPAPVIRDLHYSDENINGYPVVAFHLDLTDAVMNALTSARALNGDLILDAQARVQNGEWIELFGSQQLKSDKMQMRLQELAEHEKDIAKDTPIELRCRYIYEPYNGTEEEYPTEFSNVLTFGAQDMHVLPQETALTTARTRRAAEMTDNDCRGPGSEEEQEGQSILDGPWILLIILAVIVLLIIIFLLSRRNKEDKK